MPGEGGATKGRDLIRFVRIGVCVWVQGVYLLKSSVGRRGRGFIKMSLPLPVSASISGLPFFSTPDKNADPLIGLEKTTFTYLLRSPLQI